MHARYDFERKELDEARRAFLTSMTEAARR